MTDTTPSASGREHSGRRLAEDRRLIVVVAVVVCLLGIVIGGYLYGRFLSSRDLGGRDQVIEELRAESQKRKRDYDQKVAQLTAMQAKLAATQAMLDAIMPSANTYNISPNQTLIVADGRITVGLIGSPSNESVTLNVNGKQQVLGAGQVVTVAAEGSANCQIGVQSFDVFKAVLTASCSGAKPR